MNEVVADGVRMAGEGLSSGGEPERVRFAGRADSIGRTYPAGKRMRRRRGGANRLINCRRDPLWQRSSLREFLCRIWYLCWNLTKVEKYTSNNLESHTQAGPS